LLNNSNNRNIQFTFSFKHFIKMLLYFLLLILFHQVLIYLFEHRIYIPQMYNPKELLLYFGASLLTTSLCEEILYRGLLYNLLFEKMKKSQHALIITAVIFGLAHIQFGLLPVFFLIIVGYIFSKMYIETDSLLYPILFHTLLNLYL